MRYEFLCSAFRTISDLDNKISQIPHYQLFVRCCYMIDVRHETLDSHV